MPTKIMVASGQFGYRPALVNEQNQIIQVGAPFKLRVKAQVEAAAWARRAMLWFDDSIILPRDTVTHAQLQVGTLRSVRAFGAAIR